MDSRQKIGAVLGDRYEILSELGEGGFSTVYKARQLATGQFVAIKVLQLGSRGEPQARGKRIARFQREMQLCGQLHHPNIVRLIDSGQADEDVVYSVFEFVPGKDLARVLAEEGPLDPREARHFMLQVLDALGCAHAQGVIHRDLKPANLMVIPTGARRNVLVLDFGIGAFTEEAKRADDTRITLTNESVGTPAYAAPEQLRGQPPTPRSDLYAWGLVFLECLTGKRVIAGDTAADVIFNQLAAEPVPIPATLIDHPLGDLLRRATIKDAAARNVTTEGLLRELEDCDVSGLRPRSAPARLQLAAPDMRTETVELARHGSGTGLPDRLVEGERRQITAVCCSLSASSLTRGRVDTEELDLLLGLQQEACTMIARRFSGHIAGVLGDTILFYFGYPTAREDAARRAAQAASEMAADLLRRRAALEAERKVRIDLRVGIHTGLVIARELRDPTITGIGYVVGTTPKIAARLSAAAEPGSILVSTETQRLLRKHFALEEDGTRLLEGIEAPIEVFQLREGSASGGRRDVPLVGRARELELLLERWGRARGGAGQAVLIAGEPGIGKSRLVRELEEELGDEAHTWLESRCTPDSANSAFHPIIDLLDRLIDPRREAKLDDKADRLEALLARHGFDLGEVMPLVAPLLSVALPDRWAPLEVSPQKQRELTRNAVLSLLFEMAEQQPVALFIEDLHWADPSTLELLGQLVREVGSSRVLALFTARSEFTPSWSPTTALQIQLARLGRLEIEQMATNLAGDRALPVEVLDTIASRTDGVPLFVEDLVLAMVEAGVLVEKEGRYALARPLSEMTVPATLRDLLVARLDRLGRAKETAQVAAAIGREFTFELLAAVSPRSEAEAQEDLDKLVTAELVHRKRRLKSGGYSFKHALVRDAAYDSMLKRSREHVHARIAKALEERFPDVVSDRPDLLAHHHAAAEQKREAIAYAQRAGMAALMRSANAEAVSHAKTALAWLDALDGEQERTDAELSLNGILAPALMSSRGWTDPELKAAIDRARSLLDPTSQSPHVAPTLWSAFIFYHVEGKDRSMARAIGEHFFSLVERSGDAGQEAVARSMLGQCALMEGRFAAAHEQLEHALQLCDPVTHRGHTYVYGQDTRCMTAVMLAITLWYSGYPTRGMTLMNDALSWAYELKYPINIAGQQLYLILLHYERGDQDEVVKRSDALLEFASQRGLPAYQGYASILRAWGQSDLEAALGWLQGLETAGTELAISFYRAMVAKVEAAHHRYDDAIQRLTRALAQAQQSGELLYVSELLRLRGTFLLERAPDAHEEAEGCLREAASLARHQGAKLLELQAMTSLCKLSRMKDRAAEDRSSLASLLAWFTEGSDIPQLREARRVLDDASAP